MKKESIFSNKTFLIVLSVIIAFVSWVVVSLDSNDTKGRTISGLSIDMDQVDDTISELGLSVISSDDTRVAVRVEGVTYAIGNLEASDIRIYPDVSRRGQRRHPYRSAAGRDCQRRCRQCVDCGDFPGQYPDEV